MFARLGMNSFFKMALVPNQLKTVSKCQWFSSNLVRTTLVKHLKKAHLVMYTADIKIFYLNLNLSIYQLSQISAMFNKHYNVLLFCLVIGQTNLFKIGDIYISVLDRHNKMCYLVL